MSANIRQIEWEYRENDDDDKREEIASEYKKRALNSSTYRANNYDA